MPAGARMCDVRVDGCGIGEVKPPRIVELLRRHVPVAPDGEEQAARLLEGEELLELRGVDPFYAESAVEVDSAKRKRLQRRDVGSAPIGANATLRRLPCVSFDVPDGGGEERGICDEQRAAMRPFSAARDCAAADPMMFLPRKGRLTMVLSFGFFA